MPFSPKYFPTGFKGVLVAYTQIGFSSSFPIGFLEEFYKTISKEE
jgi:hypothetical protein